MGCTALCEHQWWAERGRHRDDLHFHLVETGYDVDFIGNHALFPTAGRSAYSDIYPNDDTPFDRDSEGCWNIKTS